MKRPLPLLQYTRQLICWNASYRRLPLSASTSWPTTSRTVESPPIGRLSGRCLSEYLFRLSLFILAAVVGLTLYHRTTNMWALKNLGDSLLMKSIGRRPIVIGAFHRPPKEQILKGAYAVLQFVGDTRQTHELYCQSEGLNEEGKHERRISTALIERIHKGKRGVNDICAWSGHLAECQIVSQAVTSIRLATNQGALAFTNQSMEVPLEEPLRLPEGKPPHSLAVCVGAMYIYTDWQIMVTGIETWLALGASVLLFLVQSASTSTYTILREYESKGHVIIRHWPKWPILSDVNPNGLVLSRGIEEAHVNCLYTLKPIAEMIVFTDIDDMLMPLDPMEARPNVNVEILRAIFREHPTAGSLLFEHRDVQFSLDVDGVKGEERDTLQGFNFDFLRNSHYKTSCKVWRMKTRTVINASRVDSVNMHEAGIHRFGFTQVRIPCRQAHFYHLRHSYKNIALNEHHIDLSHLQSMLNSQWSERLKRAFTTSVSRRTLEKSSTESFLDFDRCMGSINEEHWTLSVSRCLTPHVCYSRLVRNVSCVASLGDYSFTHSDGDYLIMLGDTRFIESMPNCEAPVPKYVSGTYYYMP